MPRPARGDGQQVATVQKVQEEVTSNPVPQGHHAQVTEAVDAINAHLQRVSRNLQFSVDQDSGRVVVKVVDGETDTVIRQMPSEEALAISHALDKLQGLIIEHKA
ncbi:MAG: flagellar protein FlaG [Burkholderiales bacterium]